jgi:hypothetical protein
MIRAFILGALALACAFVFSLFFSVPGFSAGLHPRCNIDFPCIVQTKPAARAVAAGVTKREARQSDRADRFRNVEFGSPMYPPETQRSFLQRGAEILGGRPAGCPRRFCGCGVSLKVFGRIIPRYNLAANWRDFAPTAPGGGAVAWRPGHVLYVEAHVSGSSYQVYDPNSGGGKIRRHVRNLSGYRFVDPHAPLRRVAER